VQKLNTRNSQQGYNTGSLSVFVALISPEKLATKSNTIYGYSNLSGRTFAAGNFDATLAPGNSRVGNTINISQGLDTTDIPFTNALSNDLKESKYLIEVDDRLAKICDQNSNLLKPSFVDDDNIATYAISPETPGLWTTLDTATNTDNVSPSVIAGPYNLQQLSFSLVASDNLRFSNYYFGQFGNTSDTASSTGGSTYGSVSSIDITVSVIGQTTGYRIDVPVRIVKIITE
jgi:hypothetical protein